MSYSILDLSKIVKEARDYFGIGYHEKSIRRYETAIPIVEARILELYSDTKLQDKWKAILKNLKDELNDIKEIMNSLDVFHNVYDKNGQIVKRPDVDVTADDTHVIGSGGVPLDMSIGHPFGYGDGGKTGTQPSSGSGSNSGEKKVVKPAGVKTGKNKPEKSYLEFLYPDGKGPDSELIEMLEREVVDTDPHVQFDDIAELEQAKQAIKEAVLLPLVVPGFFKGIRRPWKGVLLYGPPGTGKTMLAKAVASKGETTFFNVHSSSFASKWRGESEKLVRILFEMAKYYAPTVIFIDEIDSLCSQRGTGNEGEGSRRVKAEMLVQMDGANTSSSAGANEKSKEEQKKLVTVMGATNRPWDLDEALRRRFEKRIYIPLPNEKGRQALFRLNTKKIELGKDINSPKLIEMSKGYSGADISNVCREAALMPLRRELKANKGKDLEQLVKDKEFRTKINAPITMSDFEKALSHIGKSVSEKDLEQYAEWTKQFSSV